MYIYLYIHLAQRGKQTEPISSLEASPLTFYYRK